MTIFGVITKVPETGERGNLATALGRLFVDPQHSGGSWDDPPEQNLALSLACLVPVFQLGELLVIGSDDRDQFTRKPSKWSVTCEYFDDIEEAVIRVKEVTNE